jgi:hypothetical protein
LLSAKKIPAGKNGQIEARIQTESLSGPVEKRIEIVTNDPRHGAVTLSIKAVVEPEIELSESSIFFEDVPFGKEVCKEILLTVPAGKSIRILSALSRDPDVTVKLEAVPGSSGKKFKLTATQKANTKRGYHFGQIIVKTDSRLAPETVIYERGNVVAAER